ncbi:hypothetical protein B7P43_G09805 [Cryptotermes secundus]|uniref:Uncharacterized protein n=1 Tax=Cryptotermes secundus TaxID=105785 RepID=A0A2J7PS38_9NEOP|nr:hypothetical protein B7P43_G09805 [Cryptotermes secundus]
MKCGVSYEVILAEPVTVAPPKQSSPRKEVSMDNIEEKFKAAAKRKLSLEAGRMVNLAIMMSKIEEASERRKEQENYFISQTREALEQKMEVYTENRESLINDLKSRLKEHWEIVEKTRRSLEMQKREAKGAAETIHTATPRKDGNIEKIIQRMKEHKAKVVRIRVEMLEKVNQLKSKIHRKYQQSQTRREQLKQDKLEKLRNHARWAEMVRHNKERLSCENDEQQTTSV